MLLYMEHFLFWQTSGTALGMSVLVYGLVHHFSPDCITVCEM